MIEEKLPTPSLKASKSSKAAKKDKKADEIIAEDYEPYDYSQSSNKDVKL